jgi:hypothetical protein
MVKPWSERLPLHVVSTGVFFIPHPLRIFPDLIDWHCLGMQAWGEKNMESAGLPACIVDLACS